MNNYEIMALLSFICDFKLVETVIKQDKRSVRYGKRNPHKILGGKS